MRRQSRRLPLRPPRRHASGLGQMWDARIARHVALSIHGRASREQSGVALWKQAAQGKGLCNEGPDRISNKGATSGTSKGSGGCLDYVFFIYGYTRNPGTEGSGGTTDCRARHLGVVRYYHLKWK